MIASFRGQGTDDVFNGADSQPARATCPNRLWRVSAPPASRLEALKGDRAGQHRIRVNDQYRVCFR